MRRAHLGIATALALTVLPGTALVGATASAVAVGTSSIGPQIQAPAGVVVTEASASADGRWVTFVGQSDDSTAIYRHDSIAQTTERVVTRTARGDLEGRFAEPTISGDGDKIAFTLHDADHSGDGWDPQSQVYLTDTDLDLTYSGNTQLMSADSEWNPGNDGSAQPALSADGKFLAFTTSATDVITGAHAAEAAADGTDIALRHLSDGRIDGIAEVVADVDASDPSISGDGSQVVFTRRSASGGSSLWLFERPKGVYGGGETLRQIASADRPSWSAAAPAAVWNPLVYRSAAPARGLGYSLQADPADWGSLPQSRVTRQWLRDGHPIRGATGLTYEVTRADVGGQLAVREHLKVPGSPAGEVTSRAYHVTRDHSVLTTPTQIRQSRGTKVVIRLRVSHRPGGESYVPGAVEPQGTVRARLGKKSAAATVGPGGWVRLVLGPKRPGKYTIKVVHRGTGFVAPAPAQRVTLVVRSRR